MGVRLDSAAHREVRRLALTLAALAIAIGFEHFVIHREVIQPAMSAYTTLPPWMWGALFLPEMAVCVVAGWRIRSLTWLAIYAAAGGVVRELIFQGLGLTVNAGHAEAAFSARMPFSRGALLVGIAYFLILGLASMTAREPGPVPNR